MLYQKPQQWLDDVEVSPNVEVLPEETKLGIKRPLVKMIRVTTYLLVSRHMQPSRWEHMFQDENIKRNIASMQ
jgi:hypothetical protein